MADIKVSGKMLVKTLKKSFKDSFGSTLRVYNGNKNADDTDTLASIRKDGTSGGELEVSGKMLVGNFEKKMLDNYGIRVQVATPDDSKLSDNEITLTKSGQEEASAPVAKKVVKKVAAKTATKTVKKVKEVPKTGIISKVLGFFK